jgi:hypothetical protein
MASEIQLTATALLVGGLVLSGMSSPLGPPLALLGALGLALHLGATIRRFVRFSGRPAHLRDRRSRR